MYRPFIFLIFCCVQISFLMGCQEHPTATKNVETAVSTMEKPDKKAQVALEKKDTIQLQPIKTVATQPTPSKEKSVASIKKVTAKKKASTDRKKEPPTVKKKKKRPKIEFEEISFKFGTIKEGDKVKHKFKFKNTGDAPLTINKVDVSCGCTFPSYPFLPISPKEGGEIEVIFNSKHKLGRQKPTVTVVTNGRPRTIKLYLEGFVE